jgi:hypothetical protein
MRVNFHLRNGEQRWLVPRYLRFPLVVANGSSGRPAIDHTTEDVEIKDMGNPESSRALHLSLSDLYHCRRTRRVVGVPPTPTELLGNTSPSLIPCKSPPRGFRLRRGRLGDGCAWF